MTMDPITLRADLKYQREYTMMGTLVARLTKLCRDTFCVLMTQGDETLKKDGKFKSVAKQLEPISKFLSPHSNEIEKKRGHGKICDVLLPLEGIDMVLIYKKVWRFRKKFNSFLDDDQIAITQALEAKFNEENRKKFIFDVLIEVPASCRQWCLDEMMRSAVLTFGDYLRVIRSWLDDKDHPFTNLLQADMEAINDIQGESNADKLKEAIKKLLEIRNHEIHSPEERKDQEQMTPVHYKVFTATIKILASQMIRYRYTSNTKPQPDNYVVTKEVEELVSFEPTVEDIDELVETYQMRLDQSSKLEKEKDELKENIGNLVDKFDRSSLNERNEELLDQISECCKPTGSSQSNAYGSGGPSSEAPKSSVLMETKAEPPTAAKDEDQTSRCTPSAPLSPPNPKSVKLGEQNSKVPSEKP